jgi:hypothetical protein
MQNSEKIFIFLSGSVNKGRHDTRDSEHFWTQEYENFLVETINGGAVVLLNPNNLTVDKFHSQARYEEDVNMLLESDLILVDARTKKGIGIGAEMMLAKLNSIPIFSFCPLNTHYHKVVRDHATGEDKEWVHPFICGLSTKIFDNLEELAYTVNEMIANGEIRSSRKR